MWALEGCENPGLAWKAPEVRKPMLRSGVKNSLLVSGINSQSNESLAREHVHGSGLKRAKSVHSGCVPIDKCAKNSVTPSEF